MCTNRRRAFDRWCTLPCILCAILCQASAATRLQAVVESAQAQAQAQAASTSASLLALREDAMRASEDVALKLGQAAGVSSDPLWVPIHSV